MTIGDWVVGIFLNVKGDGVREMQRLAVATDAANDALKRQQGFLSRSQFAINQHARKMEEIAQRRQAQIGNAATGIAVAGVAAMTDAVTEAAKLQTIFASIQNATGATAGQMARYSQQFYDIADKNGMAVQDVADIVRVFARSSGGRMSLAQLMQITGDGGAQFAMVMKNARGESYDDAAMQAITLAHQFRAYDPKSQAQMFDAMAHLGEMMPHNLNAAVTQMGYFLPKLKTMGVDDSSAVAMMAWLDQSGYGRGKGGTGLRSLVEQGLGPLQLTSHAQAGKANLLHQMGLLDAQGHSPFYNVKTKAFDIFGYLGSIHDWIAKQPRMDNALKTITGAFGAQGGNIAALMADPQIVAGLIALRKFATDRRVSLQEQAGRYEHTVGFQSGRAWNNFQSLMTELGTPWLKQIAGVFENVGDMLHAAQKWLHVHPGVEKQIGAAVAVVATIATALAGLASLGVLAQIGSFVAGGSAAGSAFMGAFGWIDGVLFRGIFSKIVLGVMDLFSTGGGLGMLARFVGPILERFIPFVGWALLAMEALNVLVNVIKNAPTIVTAIHNWWVQWKGPIAYTLGWAFASLSNMLLLAIEGLFKVVGATITTAASNVYLLAMPGGQAQLAQAMALAAVAAQKDWDSSQKLDGMSELMRGLKDGLDGHGFQLHTNVTVNVAKNAHADVTVDHNPGHSARKTGSYVVSPMRARFTPSLQP